jgi:hypothetical protein
MDLAAQAGNLIHAPDILAAVAGYPVRRRKQNPGWRCGSPRAVSSPAARRRDDRAEGPPARTAHRAAAGGAYTGPGSECAPAPGPEDKQYFLAHLPLADPVGQEPAIGDVLAVLTGEAAATS